MEVLLVLIPISFLLAFAGLGAFVWAAKTGQYDDTEKPAEEILNDDSIRRD